MKTIYTDNEWSDLQSVIVGSATNAHWPVFDPTFRQLEKTTKWQESPVPKGLVPQYIVDEANEDLQKLADYLTSIGVEVIRPFDLDFQSFDGMYNYCPRDRVLIVGDQVIDAPMLYPTRIPEIEAIQQFLPSNLISCNNDAACFDAANVCRLGKDLLYLVSDSGNYEGAKWLQEVVGTDRVVHVLDNIYSGVHIDSTISPVNSSLVVINSDRINKNNLPDVFKDWDIISMSREDLSEQSFVNYPYASNYIGLNFLTVRPDLVICDPDQTVLRRALERRGIETVGIKLRHSRTLGGGHHCVTLDLKRK